MSNYYDPVAHWIQILAQRVVQFIGLTALLSVITWGGLLHWYFPDSPWIELVRWSWNLSQNSNRYWQGVLVLCMVIGTLLIGWLFTTVILLTRLQSGERHHRGPRVVQHEQD